MKKEYSIQKNTMTELLNDIDNFETKMKNFIKKYSKYSYFVNIKSEGETWIGEVKIITDEKTTIT